MKKVKACLAVFSIAMLTTVLAGCGDNGASAPATQTTAPGAVNSASGTVGTTSVTVAAPTGVTLLIPANTALTDLNGKAVSAAGLDLLLGMETELMLQHVLLTTTSGAAFGALGSLMVPAVVRRLQANRLIPSPHFQEQT